MANSLRKISNYLGLTEDEGLELPVPTPTPRPSLVAAQKTTTSVTARPTVPAVAAQPQTMDRIVTIAPRVYGDVRAIGEYYREGNPVIMSLDNMEESERKRLIDFASGLVFGHAGTIEKIHPRVFLLTPPHVSISSEEKSAAAEASFFNQS
ncbi:MAG: cell division protein SepF [Actinomycetota bacterium]